MTMTVKIGGSVVGEFENGVNVMAKTFDNEVSNFKSVDKKVNDFFLNKALPISSAFGLASMSSTAFAAGTSLADRLMPLINMVQDFALPVGIVVSSWGLIEIILGNFESGKHKLKYSIIGFIGMFLIPEVFYAIKEAFDATNPYTPTVGN